MEIIKTKVFNTISQRILYGLNFMYSAYAPVESEKTDVQSQKKLHEKLQQILDRLYENPKLLNFPDTVDEAWEWHELNNSKPELDALYKSICKTLFDFYKFLYFSSLKGTIEDGSLFVSSLALKEERVSYKAQYKILLHEVGIEINKQKSGICFFAERGIMESFQFLAERVPVHVNPWTPYALINFACCSFTGDFGYLLSRVDNVADLGGLLPDIERRCLENGYKRCIKCSFGPSGFDFRMT